MTTFVLVAGAFHGAWAWAEVVRLLEADGHAAHAIDLTGQGARAHAATPETSLSTHIGDVVEFVEQQDIRDVVLVGHSYSGLVVTGAADRMRDRVAHIVYTDATVPTDGMSAADYAGPAMTKTALDAAGGDWLVGNFLPLSKFGPFANDAAQAEFAARLGKHPVATFFDKIELRNAPVERRTFVRSTRDPLALFEAFAVEARTSPDWAYHEIATGHDAMLTAPDEVAAILAGVETSARTS